MIFFLMYVIVEDRREGEATLNMDVGEEMAWYWVGLGKGMEVSWVQRLLVCWHPINANSRIVLNHFLVFKLIRNLVQKSWGFSALPSAEPGH